MRSLSEVRAVIDYLRRLEGLKWYTPGTDVHIWLLRIEAEAEEANILAGWQGPGRIDPLAY